jgi:uncharacterized protein
MLTLSLMPGALAICRFATDSSIPAWALSGYLSSITRTADELSIVCPQAQVPVDIPHEGDWRCLKVHGPLDFSMTGVMASLAAPLAEAGISMFAISTFDTDYLLVKQDKLDAAILSLTRAGHSILYGD